MPLCLTHVPRAATICLGESSKLPGAAPEILELRIGGVPVGRAKGSSQQIRQNLLVVDRVSWIREPSGGHAGQEPVSGRVFMVPREVKG